VRPRLQSGVSALNLTVRRLPVPKYNVIVHGQGIRVPMDGTLATSFFKPICVTATDPLTAERRALQLIESEWSVGPYAAINQGNPPRLTIDSVSQLPWWNRFVLRQRGYVFAPDDPPNAV
jgi:hypothetical protein